MTAFDWAITILAAVNVVTFGGWRLLKWWEMVLEDEIEELWGRHDQDD